MEQRLCKINSRTCRASITHQIEDLKYSTTKVQKMPTTEITLLMRISDYTRETKYVLTSNSNGKWWWKKWPVSCGFVNNSNTHPDMRLLSLTRLNGLRTTRKAFNILLTHHSFHNATKNLFIDYFTVQSECRHVLLSSQITGWRYAPLVSFAAGHNFRLPISCVSYAPSPRFSSVGAWSARNARFLISN